jgi:DNA (cytosine-5)-methyltransferase 1
MRFGSVCSGIEAASVAWHPLGWEAAWLSEIEPFPCAVLKHHYPDVPNHGDMTLLPEKILSGEVEAPDLFCGGTPCQAFSVAGLRNSLDDARGNLSLTFVGIANAIDHVRSLRRDPPAIIFWENVPGVLNTKDNAFGCFLGALAGEGEQIVPPGEKWTNSGCVFGPQRTVAWRVLDAQYFGVAQRRRRVFVVASARDDFNPAEILFEFEGVRRDTAPSRESREEVAGTIAARFGISRNNHEECVTMPIPARMVSFGEYSVDGTASAMKARDWKDATDLVAQAIPLNTMNLLGREVEDGRRGFGIGEVGDPCPTLTKAHSHAVAQPIAFHPTQDPISSTNGTTHGLGCGSSGGQASIAVAVGTDCFNGNITGDIACTMGTMGSSVNASGPTVMQSMAVRRLTPTECERLQGFPDGYTNIPWRKASESPDGPRYKALGNSWAVPVVRWIGKRIQERITT